MDGFMDNETNEQWCLSSGKGDKLNEEKYKILMKMITMEAKPC